MGTDQEACIICKNHCYLFDKHCCKIYKTFLKKEFFSTSEDVNFGSGNLCLNCLYIIDKLKTFCATLKRSRKSTTSCYFQCKNTINRHIRIKECTSSFKFVFEYIMYKKLSYDEDNLLCVECLYNLKNWCIVREQLGRQFDKIADEPEVNSISSTNTDLRQLCNKALSNLKNVHQIIATRRKKINIPIMTDNRMLTEIPYVLIYKNSQVSSQFIGLKYAKSKKPKIKKHTVYEKKLRNVRSVKPVNTKNKRKMNSKVQLQSDDPIQKFACNICREVFISRCDYKLHLLQHEKLGTLVVNVTRHNLEQVKRKRKILYEDVDHLIKKWIGNDFNNCSEELKNLSGNKKKVTDSNNCNEIALIENETTSGNASGLVENSNMTFVKHTTNLDNIDESLGITCEEESNSDYTTSVQHSTMITENIVTPNSNLELTIEATENIASMHNENNIITKEIISNDQNINNSEENNGISVADESVLSENNEKTLLEPNDNNVEKSTMIYNSNKSCKNITIIDDITIVNKNVDLTENISNSMYKNICDKSSEELKENKININKDFLTKNETENSLNLALDDSSNESLEQSCKSSEEMETTSSSLIMTVGEIPNDSQEADDNVISQSVDYETSENNKEDENTELIDISESVVSSINNYVTTNHFHKDYEKTMVTELNDTHTVLECTENNKIINAYHQTYSIAHDTDSISDSETIENISKMVKTYTKSVT